MLVTSRSLHGTPSLPQNAPFHARASTASRRSFCSRRAAGSARALSHAPCSRFALATLASSCQSFTDRVLPALCAPALDVRLPCWRLPLGLSRMPAPSTRRADSARRMYGGEHSARGSSRADGSRSVSAEQSSVRRVARSVLATNSQGDPPTPRGGIGQGEGDHGGALGVRTKYLAPKTNF